MSKKTINFKNMTEQAKNQLDTFKKSMVEIAIENVAFYETKKQLEKRLEAIKESRKNDLDQGMALNDVLIKYPTIEVDNEIRKETLRHKEVLKPLEEGLNSAYTFIPETMYAAYIRKIEEGKRGEFLDAISAFWTI